MVPLALSITASRRRIRAQPVRRVPGSSRVLDRALPDDRPVTASIAASVLDAASV